MTNSEIDKLNKIIKLITEIIDSKLKLEEKVLEINLKLAEFKEILEHISSRRKA